MLLKTSSSHEEGAERKWSILTKKFIGQGGNVKKLSCVQVSFSKDNKGCPVMTEVGGSAFEIEADLVILALGFVRPEKEGLLECLGVELDRKGNVKTAENYQTSVKNIFAAGDMRRGQSLIVHAISEGRRTAHFMDKHLSGSTSLSII
jgi:glutamate synthase (NADPH/NADH) small chain